MSEDRNGGFATFGSGQVGYPGYLRVVLDESDRTADAWTQMRWMAHEVTNGKWCGFYWTLEDVHPNDRIHRGDVVMDDDRRPIIVNQVAE